MTYKKTIEFLYAQLPVFHRIGKAAYKEGLGNIIELDDYFGNPHRKFRSVHIAGTNGKGSVSHMLASVFMEAGFRTALYTSPHLKDFCERIRVNGKKIPRKQVAAFVENNMQVISKLHPSFFELSVAMAFDFFAQENVDIAIIETGLGGRLDSTNIIKPVLSVITNIGYDHMDLLGDTLPKIAFEKAGIIKLETGVVIGETQQETETVFRSAAEAASAAIHYADKTWRCKLGPGEPGCKFRSFVVENLQTNEELECRTPLTGEYQALNIQTVAAAWQYLKSSFNLDDGHLLKGIERSVVNTGLKGRWQVLGKKPLVICDTGHNKDGLTHVLKQVESTPKKELHMVVGFVSDKDLGGILTLFPRNARYYFTKAGVPRALNEEVLKESGGKYGLYGSAYPTVELAVSAAKENAREEDMIFIGGSTFVVAEIL
jgi:dihydrofolate synthase/folylpolyglutamate synthase